MTSRIALTSSFSHCPGSLPTWCRPSMLQWNCSPLKNRGDLILQPLPCPRFHLVLSVISPSFAPHFPLAFVALALHLPPAVAVVASLPPPLLLSPLSRPLLSQNCLCAYDFLFLLTQLHLCGNKSSGFLHQTWLPLHRTVCFIVALICVPHSQVCLLV